MRRTFGFIILAGMLAVFAPRDASAQLRTIHSEKSLYRNIFITEDADLRCMTFRRANAGTRQTCYKKSDPKELYFPYARMMVGALYLAPDPKRVLIIGLGGGTLPMAIREFLPDANIDVAELDAAVVKAAREYFPFKEDPKLKVHIDDGRVFVKKAVKAGVPYDLVMLDAFEDDYIPEHLLTREFLLEIKSIMTPGGVIAANTFSSSGLYPYESATYADVFGEFYNLKASNRIIWAQNGPLAPRETLDANAKRWAEAFDKRGVRSGMLFLSMNGKKDWPDDTRVLTDQYAPSNLLNSRKK